ncbi:alanine racemase C-terminal domain-containing protein, partial [Burkholderia pseudomallei]
GRVTMDMLTVDLTPCPNAGVGTAVELWGEQGRVDDVAEAAGTIGYELMGALARRVPVTVAPSPPAAALAQPVRTGSYGR